MAKVIKKSNAAQTKKLQSTFLIYWEKTNYILLFVGIFSLIIGYLIMSIGEWDSTTSLVVSPIILFIAYIIIFPISILYRKKNRNENVNNKL
jgi:hypothetical protein